MDNLSENSRFEQGTCPVRGKSDNHSVASFGVKSV
jgi:hypothetical protein